jgi:DNA polymerase
MGADKLYGNYGDILDAAGIDAADVVRSWREKHAKCRRLWYQCQDAFVKAIAGEASEAGPFTFAPSGDGADVMLWLPSGRPIVYCEARIDGEGRPKYLSAKGWEHLYGGKIVENAIQALCRDLLSGAMVRAEDQGIPIVMHVHDEPVAEVDESAGQGGYDALRECMRDVPDWADGFPIDASGFTGKWYRK